ncbi:lipid-A-disaccharide synthase-related protein [Leptolyngbya sp. NIES-2104]|uniref:lipid-A-disaccharide synthase-related protein n=1 Tax=Leptolyngbya sp. NIES-2104 TaxID=1552121 RepID=UPI0006EC7150|nr:lipid-A-disaccharide synthase-related protein [Leptolyngbya sp. NIES-2104]GAP94084.1 lipid A disaccharide synthetase related enzyme [Leptolyngbya sp. NIES-2104]
MRLLCLSNGHGEDTIAIRILQALQQKSDCSIEALPIVGEGRVYRKANIPVIGSVKVMPSGGFIYMDNKQLVRDIQGGLVKLTLEQIKTIKHWAKEDGLILAVGDIVPMLFAWMSSAPFAFVATAKSEYYIRDEKGELPRKSWWDDRLERSTGCIFQPWDRWLMKRSQCKAVFPRDRLTAQVLKRFNVPAFDLGNPMMDGLEWSGSESFDGFTIALVPGSRPPECFANWELILQAIDNLSDLKRPMQFLSAIAPGIDLDQLHHLLVSYRWRSTEPNTYVNGYGDNLPALKLMPGRFAECIQRSEIAIAMAGTATEQFIGLGKPALIMPGAGPQFTPAFAEAQTRLLGASVTLVSHPSQMSSAIRSLLENPDRIQVIADNGRRRMGEPGAADRISDRLLQIMQSL